MRMFGWPAVCFFGYVYIPKYRCDDGRDVQIYITINDAVCVHECMAKNEAGTKVQCGVARPYCFLSRSRRYYVMCVENIMAWYVVVVGLFLLYAFEAGIGTNILYNFFNECMWPNFGLYNNAK